jgi:uncharacterized protein (TIGR03083 family)
MNLRLQTSGGCDFDPEHLLGVFSQQRQRFVTELQGFGPADWAAPTRCTEWSAHEVVRHLCDTNMNAMAIAPEDRTLDVSAGYDPRITPRKWLTSSDGETPEGTLRRFLETTQERFAGDRARLAQGDRFDVRLPYGPADWTVRMLHGFWDSWLHERDVLLAKGREHPTDGEATAYATAYGLFIAAAVASRFGAQVHERLTFGGNGGGVFDVDNRDGVALTVTREATAGPPAAQVADALAGRASGEALGDLPASSRTALLLMADFFTTPAEPNPARSRS